MHHAENPRCAANGGVRPLQPFVILATAVLPAKDVRATTPVIPAKNIPQTTPVILAQVAVPPTAVIPAQVAVPLTAVIPAQAGIHVGACRRSSRRDLGLPASRQPLPGGGSHWGGLR